VSHELRTPLSAVAQFVALLADGTAGELNEDQVDFLGVVQRNVQQLRRMIDDLLTVTRLHGQRLSVDPSPIEVTHVLEHARRSLAVAADDHGVELVVEARAGDVPLVLADADRVFEVVVNLVDNAVKFSPAGGQVVMTVALGPGGDDVIVSVADGGPGIDPAYRASVFDPFFQAPERSERTRRGLGLGLYVCHELVTRHGGRIWIDSTPTPGTRIRFSLPVADIAQEPQDLQERI
jgi:NtrC-family two-component system sensor histidine kinase KinB